MKHSISLQDVIKAIEVGERRSKHAQIIAIDGPAGAGKTTLARKLEASYPTKLFMLFIWMTFMTVGKTP